MRQLSDNRPISLVAVSAGSPLDRPPKTISIRRGKVIDLNRFGKFGQIRPLGESFMLGRSAASIKLN